LDSLRCDCADGCAHRHSQTEAQAVVAKLTKKQEALAPTAKPSTPRAKAEPSRAAATPADRKAGADKPASVITVKTPTPATASPAEPKVSPTSKARQAPGGSASTKKAVVANEARVVDVEAGVDSDGGDEVVELLTVRWGALSWRPAAGGERNADESAPNARLVSCATGQGDEADRTYLDSTTLPDGQIVERGTHGMPRRWQVMLRLGAHRPTWFPRWHRGHAPGHVVYMDDGKREPDGSRPKRTNTIMVVEALWTVKYAGHPVTATGDARSNCCLTRYLTVVLRRDKVFVGGRLLLQPHQTFHVVTRMFHENEIFRSNMRHVGPIEDIVGFAAVLSMKDYQRGRPAGMDLKDVWVCESRYIDQSRSFARIKNFAQAFPEPKLRPLPPFEVFPDAPRKVPSVRSPHWVSPAPAPAPAPAHSPAKPAGGKDTLAAGTAIAEAAATTPPVPAAAAALLGLAFQVPAPAPAPPGQYGPLRGGGGGGGGGAKSSPAAGHKLVLPAVSAIMSSIQSGAPTADGIYGSTAGGSALAGAPMPGPNLAILSRPPREIPVPAVRTVPVPGSGASVIQRQADGFLHGPQLLRAIGVPVDRYRVLLELLSEHAAPTVVPPGLDRSLKAMYPLTFGPWCGCHCIREVCR